VTPFVVFALMGCAGTPAPEVARPPVVLHDPVHARFFANGLSDDITAARAYLQRGLTTRDLDYVGVDEVSLRDSIDLVLQALDDDDARLRDLHVLAAVDLYLLVRREAITRRVAGTDSCMPDIR